MPIRILLLTTCLLTCALGAADPDKVGVLYIERTFESSTLVQGIQKDLSSKAGKVGAQIEAINGELEKLKAELESLPESAPAFLQTQEQFEVLKLRRKLYIERSQKLLHQAEVEQLKEGYQAIREALAEYAEAKDYDLVFMAPLPEIRAQRLQELNLELATHSVLYHRDDMDITDDFTAWLNETTPNLDRHDDEEEEDGDAISEDGDGDGATSTPVIDLDSEE